MRLFCSWWVYLFDLAQAWRPYLETCIELFGADRCMFESDYPMSKMSTSYIVYWNAMKKIASKASSSEKAKLFSGTANTFYKLD